MFLRLDCRYFLGDRPCRFNRLCEGCDLYEPMGTRILIIKLGASGDVLRTTPILKSLKDKYTTSHITWLVDKDSLDVLNGNPFIDRVLVFDTEAVVRLMVEDFDVIINLDKAHRACAMAELVKGKKRYGFGLSRYGNIYPLNRGCNYAFNLGLSDDLKFRQNRQTYQEMLFESIEMDYKKEEYVFNLLEEDLSWAREYLMSQGLREGNLIIGLNTGGGDAFAKKGWYEEGFHALAELCVKELDARVLILGGPKEVERNKRLCSTSNVPLINTGNYNPLGRFAGIIKCCDLVVSGDTLGMHIAIAVKTPVVALFFSTCPQEIEFYGRGMAIKAGVDCAPCYKKDCDRDDCIRDISVQKVYSGIVALLESVGRLYCKGLVKEGV